MLALLDREAVLWVYTFSLSDTVKMTVFKPYLQGFVVGDPKNFIYWLKRKMIGWHETTYDAVAFSLSITMVRDYIRENNSSPASHATVPQSFLV